MIATRAWGGIFAGTDEIILSVLEERSADWQAFDGAVIVANLYDRILENWHEARKGGHPGPSRANWRWEKRLEYRTEDMETVLERNIARIATDCWANQIPTADEMTSYGEGNRNVDLGFRVTQQAYELIELKVASNNPLYAAMQILRYGLLYALFRRETAALRFNSTGKHVLQARLIGLRVLAPAKFYCGWDLMILERQLIEGLSYFCEGLRWRMDFRFMVFLRWFTPENMNPADLNEDNVTRAIRDRYPLVLD